MSNRNVIGGYGSAKRGSTVNIPGGNSTRPAQRVEVSDKLWGNPPGGSAPGGIVGVPLSTRQALAETSSSRANANDLPAHQTGVHRVGRQSLASPVNTNPEIVGHPFSPDGKSRGQSPLIPNQTRGGYRP
jgi:hypothetical protein